MNNDNDNKDKIDNSEESQADRTKRQEESVQKQPPQIQGPRPPLMPPLLQPTPPGPFDICDLFNGLEKAETLFDSLIFDELPDCPKVVSTPAKDEKEKDTLSDSDLSEALASTANILKNVNEIRNQLVNLNIETFGNNFFDNMVEPFLVTMRDLASTSANLSVAANYLTQTNLEEVKRHKVKDTIDLIYDLNEKAEDVFEVLKKRVNILIKIGKLETKKGFSKKFFIRRR